MTRKILTAAMLLTVLSTATAVAAPNGLFEIQTGKQTLRGKVVAHDNSQFWLLEQDGQLKTLPIDQVSGFRKISPVFRGHSAATLRSGLRREFGSEYEVAGSTYHLVVAPKGQAKAYVELFDTVYRQFTSYFSSRGFRLKRPPFPMVAVVFPDKARFLSYVRKDGVNFRVSALGYYYRKTNRVALFDPGWKGKRVSKIGPGTRGRLAAPISAALRNVIVHEATHQAAFNTGLHNRLGSTPKWVSEGLATVFEAPGIRNRTGKRGAKSRVNAGRLHSFRSFREKSRKPRSLASFLADDQAFGNSNPAYAEAWALSFFLVERKSSQYTRYIRLLMKRDPMKPYPARDRIADFQTAFGDDLDRLEVEYLRFIESLD